MNHQFYGAAHATLPRRATVPAPASLAPTASMIDPALEHHAFQYTTPQFTHNGGNRLHNQSHPNMMNGFPQPLSQHQQHQQPQTNSAQSTPQALSNPSTERCLPSKDVNEANFDSAYVQFILYCNPSIPFNVETEELRKGFLNPPRSDGNSFSPWNLFHLLQRLERKEIKTWAHLVTELGVEPPDKEKNQSTQKVQQYAVRLKRWMRAFHVDAFFNYLSSKPSAYYTERPLTDAELAETMREEVAPEEDLALRALLPEWRPKRGRRKADEMTESESATDATGKRQHARASSAEFTSMFDDQGSSGPTNAGSWNATTGGSQGDLWAAAQVAIAPKTPSPAQQHQTLSANANGGVAQRMWRFPSVNATPAEIPSSPYPQSAITPRASFSASPGFADNEPKSAHPSTAGGAGGKSPGSKSRKRHAPAISSAWKQGGTPSGKIRGRPPSNRNVQDGPFGTFPANPNLAREGGVGGGGGGSAGVNMTATSISATTQQQSPQIPVRTTTTTAPASGLAQTLQPATVIDRQHQQQRQHQHQPQAQPHLQQSPIPTTEDPTPNNNNTINHHHLPRKPSKLQLQVPHQPGNPIRLATPPRVLVNGESQFPAVPISVHEEGRSGADFFTQLDEVSEEGDEVTTTDSGGGGGSGVGLGGGEGDGIDWKKRALGLMRRLQEKEDELKRVRRAVLDAVM